MSPNRALLWSVAGHACVLAAAVRHRFVWGERHEVLGVGLHHLLAAGEGLALALFVCLAGIPYLRLLRGDHDVGAIVRGGCVLALAAALAPPFLSTDVFDYLARGRVEASFGANPYVTPPAAFPDDPVIGALAYPENPHDRKVQWPGHVMPYGPLSALVQAGVAALAGGSAWLGVYAFKLLFALCHVLTALALYAALRSSGAAAARRGLLLYLWNPWLLLETAGSAHNEALVAAFLALMALGLRRGAFAPATLAFGCAVLTKHGCAVVGPFLLALAWRRRRLPAFALGVAMTGALAAVLAWRYFLEPGSLDFLLAQTANRATSLQAFVVGVLGDGAATPLVAAGYAITLAAIAARFPKVRDEESLGAEAARLTLLFLVVAMPLFSPWYHLWWLPFLGLGLRRDTGAALALLAFLGPLSYLVFATTRSFEADHQVWQWTLGLAVPCAAFAAAGRRR